MPVALTDLVAPGQTAVLTMEMQRGVVGDRSSFPELEEAVRAGAVIANTGRLLSAARAAGVPVVHCTAGFRADRLGTPRNAPLIGALLRRPDHLLDGSAATQLVPEIGLASSDIVCHRRHGVSPFIGTTLDPTLRALGVATVVATGVSLNLGVVGLAIEAVNLGYRVVVATNAVAGVPADYAADVLRHTVALVATLGTVEEIMGAWG